MFEYILIHYWDFGIFFLIYFGLVNVVYAVLMGLGTYNTYKRILEFKREDVANILQSSSLPEITFLVPVYNEKDKIHRCMDNLLSLSYRYKKIIVINDGSDDGTFELLKEKYQMEPIPLHFKQELPSKPLKGIYQSRNHPQLMLIDKVNGTKYDALNAGLNACSTPYFITVDADTIVDDDEFESIVRPILMNPKTIGIGAAVRILNGCLTSYHKISTEKFPKSYLTSMQTMEYLRSFLMRQGWNYTGGNYCIAGAFAIFSTDAVKRVKGYAPTFANDLEIVMRLHRFNHEMGIPYQIRYFSDPVAFSDCPETYSRLSKQRMLWHRGLLEALWFHKTMCLKSRFGGFGMFVYPVMVVAEAFEPLIEILGFAYVILGYILGIASWQFLALLILVSWGFSAVFTIYCLMIEEFTFRRYPSMTSLLKLIAYSCVENFGYRQMTLLWRANGFRSFFARFKTIREDTKALTASYNEMVEQYKESRDSAGGTAKRKNTI